MSTPLQSLDDIAASLDDDSSDVQKRFKRNALKVTELANALKDRAEKCDAKKTDNGEHEAKLIKQNSEYEAKELQYINKINDLMITQLKNIQIFFLI